MSSFSQRISRLRARGRRPGQRAWRLCIVAAAALGACAHQPGRSDAEAASCDQAFSRFEQSLRGSGAVDGGPRSPPGFPYLRSNRWLASFAERPLNDEQRRVWLERMRALDLDERGLAWSRRSGNDPRQAPLEELRRCGRQMLEADLADPARLAELRRAVKVPDDYSTAARIFGLYPLAVPFLRLGIADFHADIAADFAQPRTALAPATPLTLWQLPGSRDATVLAAARRLQQAPRDALGMPQLTPADWEQLFLAHAPAFVIETRGEFDRPGTPRAGGFDPDRPVVFLHRSWTRYEGHVLPQLSYLLWFSRRPAKGPLDPYAGWLDGLIWRVTLDERGYPLIHDSIHSCGCYHQFFPVQPVAAKATGFWQEPLLFPQGQTPWWKIAVHVGSGDHYLRRVMPREAARADRHGELVVRPYQDLRRGFSDSELPGGLFGADGIVPGSQRLERYYLWPSGVPDPGAMRQWGRHATAFIGRRHFDDPDLLEQVLQPRPLPSRP